MKRTSIVLTILVTVLFITTATLTAQGTGPGGRPAGVGAPQIPTTVQGNRPATAGSNKPASAGNRPETTGKPQSAGPKDAMGFENYGQYVAAKHVSENLNISLAALKTEMMGSNHLSLGAAIKKIRPDLSGQTIQAETKKANAAGKRAEAEAKKSSKTTS